MPKIANSWKCGNHCVSWAICRLKFLPKQLLPSLSLELAFIGGQSTTVISSCPWWGLILTNQLSSRGTDTYLPLKNDSFSHIGCILKEFQSWFLPGVWLQSGLWYFLFLFSSLIQGPHTICQQSGPSFLSPPLGTEPWCVPHGAVLPLYARWVSFAPS